MFNVSKIYHRESIVAERNHKLLFPCCLIKKKNAAGGDDPRQATCAGVRSGLVERFSRCCAFQHLHLFKILSIQIYYQSNNIGDVFSVCDFALDVACVVRGICICSIFFAFGRVKIGVSAKNERSSEKKGGGGTRKKNLPFRPLFALAQIFARQKAKNASNLQKGLWKRLLREFH